MCALPRRMLTAVFGGMLVVAACTGHRTDSKTMQGILGHEIKTRIEGLTTSPDGGRLAFSAIQDSPYIVICSLDGVTVERFPAPGFLETYYGLRWDPTGSYVVATVLGNSADDYLTGPYRIQKVDVSNGQWTPIAELDKDICQRGVLSPTGRNLAFRAAIDKNLYVVDLSTGKKDRITEFGDTDRLGYAWAPDGQSIYYSRNGDTGKSGIWRTHIQDRKSAPVITGIECSTLALSFSGKYLAYQSCGRDGCLRLYVANADGSGSHELPVDSDMNYAWSPDLDRIAFTSSGSLEVWDASKDESVPIDLAPNERISFPAWLDKSGKLAFVRDDKEIWAYEFASKTQRKVFELAQESAGQAPSAVPQ